MVQSTVLPKGNRNRRGSVPFSPVLLGSSVTVVIPVDFGTGGSRGRQKWLTGVDYFDVSLTR